MKKTADEKKSQRKRWVAGQMSEMRGADDASGNGGAG
jgi:hypothetical protein